MRRKQDKEKPGLREKLGGVLEISSDLLNDIPRITMNDNREIYIENYKGIIEYDENLIRLNSKGYTIKIMGHGLGIYSITDEEIGVRGVILSVEFVA